LVGLFYEWRALTGAATAHAPARTGVLERAASWLMGHHPPEVHLVEPAPGAVVTTNTVDIRYSVRPDAGRTITGRTVDYSLDGGESWTPATITAVADSSCTWDLTGGTPVANSGTVRLRVRVTDDGAPALHADAIMTATFTLARSGGDTRGPVAVG